MLYGEEKVAPCRRRSCPACGVVWLGDSHVRAVAAAHELRGAVALVTITAPGADVLPWGPDGRRVERRAAQEWNRNAPANWSALHDAAAAAARRRAQLLGVEWRLLFKAWEYQKRGVLHLHIVLPAGSKAQVAVSEQYTRTLAQNAASKGFGFVDRGKLPGKGARQSSRRLSPVAPARAAAYVAGYLASSGAGKGGIAEVAAAQGVPGAILYVSNVLTRRSGVTMRSLRDRRRVACRYPDHTGTPEGWQTACLMDAIERGGPRLTPGARASLLAHLSAVRPGTCVDGDTGEVISATPAASPPHLRQLEQEARKPGPVCAVRLDLVPHHADGSPLTWVWRRALRPSQSTRGRHECT